MNFLSCDRKAAGSMPHWTPRRCELEKHFIGYLCGVKTSTDICFTMLCILEKKYKPPKNKQTWYWPVFTKATHKNRIGFAKCTLSSQFVTNATCMSKNAKHRHK